MFWVWKFKTFIDQLNFNQSREAMPTTRMIMMMMVVLTWEACVSGFHVTAQVFRAGLGALHNKVTHIDLA